jgi:lipoprotein-anchoring transpeptidase ErfK/SrfK
VQVLLPSRPNGSVGWLHSAGAGQERAANVYRVEVDLAAFRLTILDNGKPAGQWTVGIGKPAAPTPSGRTYIMASIEETVAKYSPVILPLGSHSETHETYGGGPGTVAFHGWPDRTPFGQASSDGCIRVPPDALQALAALPIGTIVVVR